LDITAQRMKTELTTYNHGPAHAAPPNFSLVRGTSAKTAPYPSGADRIDVRILRALQRSGRLSYQRLGEVVHLSPTAVFERVKRLERNGFILGYEARLDPAKLGVGVIVYVEVQVERAQSDAMALFHDAVRSCPDILECHLVAGDFDYLLKTRVASDGDFADLLPPSIPALPGVRSLRTYSVKTGLKQHAALNF